MNVKAHRILFFYFTVFSLIFSSCRSWKDLAYLKDFKDQELVTSKNDSTKDYLIKPGDILFVSIKSINPEINALFNPETNMENQSYAGYQKFSTPQGAYLYGYEIDENGNINLPILGSISISGNNQKKAEKIIQYQADQYLKDAIVKVKLLSYKVTVIGEVRSPGVYYNYNNSFTVLEALAMANGNTDFANIKKVLVMRNESGVTKTFRLNLETKDVIESDAFYLHPNDYIIVEPDKVKNLNLNSQAYSMFISSVSILIAVLGFVLK